MRTRRRFRLVRTRSAIKQNNVIRNNNQTTNAIPTCEDETRLAKEEERDNNTNEKMKRIPTAEDEICHEILEEEDEHWLEE